MESVRFFLHDTAAAAAADGACDDDDSDSEMANALLPRAAIPSPPPARPRPSVFDKRRQRPSSRYVFRMNAYATRRRRACANARANHKS